MKQIFTLSFCLLFFLPLSAQIIVFPDANFKNALVNTNCVDADGNGSFESDADTNDDGEISIAEAQAISRLRVRQNAITSLDGIENFTNLVSLNCSWNDLTSIDVNPLINLEEFYCSGNPIASFNFNALVNLTNLGCGHMQLTELDLSALTNLQYLTCGSNQLTSINLSNLGNLISLSCSSNQLISLDTSDSPNLQYLECPFNQLSSLNIGNNPALDVLYCNDNQLTSLDTSASQYIWEFDCSNNPNLTTLNLGPSFDYITMNNIGITEYDFTEISVQYLNVSDNANLTYVKLGTFPYYDFNSTSITNNPILETISFKNGNSNFSGGDYDSASFNICNNPNLTFVCADDFEITGYSFINEAMEEIYVEGIQDLVNNCGYTNVTVNTYCSFTPGGEYYTVEGDVTLDINNNGCDSNDVGFPNINFSIADGSETGNFISNLSGSYELPLDSGSYSITPILENSDYFTITPTSLSVNFPSDTSPFMQDFCITANGTFYDLEITVFPLESARPGFDADYRILYKNNATTTLSGAVDLTFQEDLMDFISATPSVDIQAMNSLIWNFTDLMPFETRVIDFTMNINSPMETPPVNGDDVLVFEVALNTSETDETPGDNSFTLNQTVVNAYDPNDKTCLEGSTITPEQVGDYVHYRIRFENTGTASAINVVIKDNIDRTKYDLSTLVPLDASHDFIARIQDDNDDYFVEFIFENINLPFDDANNDGYVVFKIRTLDSLVLGDTIENEAEIYFDFNFPIITNLEQTTVATLSTEDFDLANNSIQLYPNPTSNLLYLKSEKAIDRVEVYDISGRLIQNISIVGSQTDLEIATDRLSAGTYFVKIKSGTSETVKKLIKQ